MVKIIKKELNMKRISKKELELRKWALELSIKTSVLAFNTDHLSWHISNAKKLVEAVTEDWNKSN